MRRLVLPCLATIAATSAYNLVIQELNLQGGPIRDNTINCTHINALHVDGKEYNYDCYDIVSTEDGTTIQARNIVFMGISIPTKKTTLPCEVVLSDGSKFTFSLTPQMNKVGKQQSNTVTSTYQPLPVDCTKAENAKKPECIDSTDEKNEEDPACDCKKPENADKDFCQKTTPAPNTIQTNNEASMNKAAQKTIIRKPLVSVVAETANSTTADTATDAATVILPLGLRHRGPGPVRRPFIRPPVEDTITDEDEEEERRIKREATVDDKTITVLASFYILDEAGNSAAVWAAVIEGIILMVLVGACLYFYCWSPRSRSVAAASADPYKEGPNYTVSYANSSFNNQRINAFQNQPAAPAAPARPSNSSYMDDYVTDNIGARPAAAAAPAASAANPVASDFRPGHQRFDSSGLVTVNLS